MNGWDVSVDAEYEANGKDNSRHWPPGIWIKWDGTCKIELKPIIGEDFPTVLRQVKSRKPRNSTVLIEEFAAKSVGFNDVKEIFAASQINLLRVEDIKILELPLCFVE